MQQQSNIRIKQSSNRVLITAFGSFPGVELNPSSLLLEELLRKSDSFSFSLEGDFIETSFNFCSNWLEQTKLDEYDWIIHLGVATTSSLFRLEKYARNQCSPFSPDVNGNCWENECIFPNEHSCIRTEVDVDGLFHSLKQKKLPVVVSEDAGDYLCNFLYYNSTLKKIKKKWKAKVLFIHIPDENIIPIGSQLDTFCSILETVSTDLFKDFF